MQIKTKRIQNNKRQRQKKTRRKIHNVRPQIVGGDKGNEKETNKTPGAIISSLEINYILNDSPGVSFNRLKSSDHNVSSYSYDLSLNTHPYICSNARYNIGALSNKIKSFNDILLFFYNNIKFTQYLSEMNLQYEATSSVDILRHNIEITLRLLFGNKYSSRKQAHTSIERDSVFNKIATLNTQFSLHNKLYRFNNVIWLNDTQTNPIIIELVEKKNQFQLVKSHILNHEQGKLRPLIQTNKKKQIQNIKNTNENENDKYNKLYIQLKEHVKKFNEIVASISLDDNNNIETMYEKIQTIYSVHKQIIAVLSELKDKLHSYTNTQLINQIDDIRRTYIDPLYEILIVLRNIKNEQIDYNSVIEYKTLPEQVHDILKKNAAPYYEMMSAYVYFINNYNTTFVRNADKNVKNDDINVDDDNIVNIVAKIESGKKMSSEIFDIVARHVPLPNEPEYSIYIAIELNPDNSCLEYDLKLGNYLTRRRTTNAFHYKPPFYLNELVNNNN